ncbi:MAG: M48 family metallopeptidase [Lachnospiraceae bacterium]|nr:M48 family metallopeptidase [Lachnospiraceae bacterium]
MAKIYTTEEQKRIQVFDNRYRKAAKEHFTKRVEYYIKQTGGSYTRITIRDQKTRWGSRSSSGTLSFNYRLMYAPPKVLDYVVVHELCHITHMNHSKEFWDMVASIMPDYKVYKQWLQDHGRELNAETHMQKLGLL